MFGTNRIGQSFGEECVSYTGSRFFQKQIRSELASGLRGGRPFGAEAATGAQARRREFGQKSPGAASQVGVIGAQ